MLNQANPVYSAEILTRFANLIENRIGIYFYKDKYKNLNTLLSSALEEVRYTSIENYYQELIKSSEYGTLWQALIEKIAIRESYFFRQFEGIRETVLPELIHKKQASKTISIWSAGCSTGEEPYTISILLKEMIPDLRNWKIELLATDINMKVVDSGKAGIYRQWSMRNIEDKFLERYFSKEKNTFQIDSNLTSMIQFNVGNIFTDSKTFPIKRPLGFDLILCRNVMIYFKAEDIHKLSEAFYQNLVDEGILIVGHSEPSSMFFNQYSPEVLSDNIIYRKTNEVPKVRTINKVTATIKPVADRRKKTNAPPGKIERRVHPDIYQQKNDILEAINSGKDPNIIKTILRYLTLAPKDAEIRFLLAILYMQNGQLTKAEEHCLEAINQNPRSIKFKTLMITIAREKKDFERAKDIAKRLIYEEKTYLPAYLELLQIAHATQNTAETNRLAAKIKQIGLQLNEDYPYDILDGLTVKNIVNLAEVYQTEA
jgi:chemotaxis protein methyltransferase CheR